MGLSPLLALKPLVIKCWQFSPLKVLAVFALMLLSSAASGFGVLMIIPLLSSVGIDLGGPAPHSGPVNAIHAWANYAGIELNLAGVLGLYILIIAVMAVTSFLNAVLSSSLRHSFVVHLRSEVSRSLFYAQWRYLNQNHMSDFMRLLTGQVQSSSASLHTLLALLSSLVLVSVYLALSLFLSGKLTFIALLCGLALVAVLWPINKRIHGSGGAGLSANTDLHRSIVENVSSLKMIKSFAAEEYYLNRMNVANRELEHQQVRMAKFNALTRLVNIIGAALVFALLFYSALKWLQLPVANLLVILFIFSRLMPQISSIQGMIQSLINQAPSYQDLMGRAQELNNWAEPVFSNEGAPTLKHSLTLEYVEYRHLEQPEKAVFTALNERIASKTTVAIVGESGAGKSTLADLISGLLEPSFGLIKVDDRIIDHTNRLLWRKKVAYVTQDVFLFHDSVRANLNWVRLTSESHVQDFKAQNQSQSAPHEQDQVLWDALAMASADDFVRSLPKGLDTVIGDRGVKLSGGERQRLALARALLANPSLLILDEATSALDRHNELKIRDALIKLDGTLTIVIIAHNETTIEHVAHRIYL